MVYRELAITVTIAAILISIPVTFFPVFQAQGDLLCGRTAGLNTTGANATGAAGNTTAAHGLAIPTVHPAAQVDRHAERSKMVSKDSDC